MREFKSVLSYGTVSKDDYELVPGLSAGNIRIGYGNKTMLN